MTLRYCNDAGKRLDNQIVRLLWTKKVNGQNRQGRRLVAKKRINAFYEMGGMQIDFSRDTAMGLLANFMQRQQNQQEREEVEQPLVYILLNEYLRAIDSPSLK